MIWIKQGRCPKLPAVRSYLTLPYINIIALESIKPVAITLQADGWVREFVGGVSHCIDLFLVSVSLCWSQVSAPVTRRVVKSSGLALSTSRSSWLDSTLCWRSCMFRFLGTHLADTFDMPKWAVTCDFQQCGILTCVDSDEPVQPPVKLRNSKWCSVSSLTFIE